MPFPTLMGELVADAIIGGSSFDKFNNANARIAVGDGTTAFSAAQTDLVGASKTRQAMDATFPTRAGNVVTWRATFGTAAANHDWNEWAIANAASGGQILNRKVETIGTKTSAATWQATAAITFNV